MARSLKFVGDWVWKCGKEEHIDNPELEYGMHIMDTRTFKPTKGMKSFPKIAFNKETKNWGEKL